jgi:hypothetical protein
LFVAPGTKRDDDEEEEEGAVVWESHRVIHMQINTCTLQRILCCFIQQLVNIRDIPVTGIAGL